MDPHRPRLLVVDDDRTVLSLIRSVALTEGFDVTTIDDAADTFIQLHKRPADLLLLDLQASGLAGVDILRSVHDISSRCQVVFMSAFGTMEHAVEAVKRGAIDYLTKPFDLARLQQLLRDVHAEGEQRRAVLNLELDLAQRLEFHGMIGRGAAMQQVFALIRRLAPHATTVLIKGEPGTGKELVARAFHRLGPRRQARFAAVSCQATRDTQFESDLFGHVRGAFAGATGHRIGTLENADGGTVFLDEVAELPLAMQARLLRLLETGVLERLGSQQPRRADVRVIAATNRDLPALVAAGRFKSELFSRLSVVDIELPPLRERREDIPYLTAAFVHAFAHRFNKALTGLTPGAERLLAGAPWHGNVRQLRNVLERACIVADSDMIVEANLAGVLRNQTVPARPAPPPADSPAPLHTEEREHIVRTLQQVRGNKAVAARLLGISRRAFYRQLERHGLHHRIATDDPKAPATPCDVEHP